ncbi:MAG: GNAT family N-acetyltransferase [Fimbriimonadaceae bacterium]
MTYKLEFTTQKHIPGVVALQRVCFPAPFPEDCIWQSEHIHSHIQLFPEGQFVIIFKDLVVASCTNILISRDDWEAHLDWETATGGLSLPKHNPQGEVLYGVDVSVHPENRQKGLAKRLYKARFEIVKSLGLQQYGTVCRIPGFLQSQQNDPAEYADAVVSGSIKDQTLTPLLKMNLTYKGVINNYLEDKESGDAGAILEWTP